ncbi:MAG: cytochrome c-type biogenesis protein [Pseudomonadota bacterium]
MRISMLIKACVLLLSVMWLTPAAAAAIEELNFDNDEQKARYSELIAELRCPKCLNSNLAGSDAPIAADLRAKIREQILAGNSDREIEDYLVERYGEFVLYKPRLHAGTFALWFGPPLLLLAGLFILRRMLAASRQTAVAPVDLNAQEQQQLNALLKDTSAGNSSDNSSDKKAGTDNG